MVDVFNSCGGMHVILFFGEPCQIGDASEFHVWLFRRSVRAVTTHSGRKINITSKPFKNHVDVCACW